MGNSAWAIKRRNQQIQYIVVARKPNGWIPPLDYDSSMYGGWASMNNRIKAIVDNPVAGAIVGGETAAKALVSKCRNLGLEADYAKLEDVLQ